MHNDRVLMPVLRVAHDTKCFSPSRCVYSYFHQQLSTTLFYHKNAKVWVV